MEHDSSRSGYHQPQPASAGRNFRVLRGEADEQWEDDVIEESLRAAEPHINLIWAQGMDEQGKPGAIGCNGHMPWHLREDMIYFKDSTITHPVIMGRKTWESLSPQFRPLKNRDNYVVTHDPHYVAEGATVMTSLEDAIELASQPAIPDDGVNRKEIWIMGGAQMYNAALNIADAVYITDVDIHVEADTFAPEIPNNLSNSMWKEEIIQDWTPPVDQDNPIKRYRFRVLRRA
ncbi:dihydrofolate reductase [Alloscardovia criceti]|uniref:dihydrofolate reductase n=1 Tax=Alloscardovia criceti TaxID=356828 RepID=UPI0003720505|nr:dihydrofolate reductase [Alloscardovia criceti]